MSLLPAPLVGRLAPSPTGAQHIGNARTYLLAWLLARSQGGRLVLRIEDIDSPRIKPGADQQAMDDLRWLGIDWDEGPDLGGTHGPYVQTQRMALYANALAQLRAAEQIYPCTCTRTDVLAAASAPHAGQEGPIYPGTCSHRSAADALTLTQPFCWRFRTSDRTRHLVDLVRGPQEMNVRRELGDFVIAKVDGAPSYQLAVVMDDNAMEVNQVLRGDDLLPSAFRQLELYEFFGFAPPQFAHVPLVIGPDGRRLAKRHGDTRLSLLRGAGCRPQPLLGLLAWSCGLQSTTQPVSVDALREHFDLALLPRTPLVFTPQMLQALLSL